MVIYSADALGERLFPLLVIVVMPLLGGRFDPGRAAASRDLRRRRRRGRGLVGATSAGARRRATGSTRRSTTSPGVLRRRRPTCRWTGSRPRRPPGPAAARVRRLRGRRPDGRGQEGRRDRAAGADARRGRGAARGAPRRRVVEPARRAPADPAAPDRRELASPRSPPASSGCSCRSSRALGQIVSQVSENAAGGRVPAPPALDDRGRAGGRRPAAAAWLLSILGAVIAFGGFTIVTATDDRLLIRRGLSSRSEATVPVGRVRAVRVVEGLFRRPFGLCALTVEVTGYADEARAARTLFPLVRVSDVRVPGRVPARAGRRGARAVSARRPRRPAGTCCAPRWAVAVAVAAWFPSGRSRCSRSRSRAYGHARAGAPRAGAWRRPAGGPLAGAWRARPCSPRPGSASRTRSPQNLFQRRADLADLSVAFGKRPRPASATSRRAARAACRGRT